MRRCYGWLTSDGECRKLLLAALLAGGVLLAGFLWHLLPDSVASFTHPYHPATRLTETGLLLGCLLNGVVIFGVAYFTWEALAFAKEWYAQRTADADNIHAACHGDV